MGWRTQQSFASSLETPAEGRAFLLEALSARLADSSAVSGDAELMVSELLTNSVKAGARTVTVTLESDDTVLRLEVSDDGGGAPTLRRPTDQDTGGRGLLIVAALAERWDVEVRPGERTTVWAELTL